MSAAESGTRQQVAQDAAVPRGPGPVVAVKYDLRAPGFGGRSNADVAASVLRQVAWLDRYGFDLVHINEHHATGDGYCPSPLVVAAAMAAVTESIRLQCILTLPLYDPVKLAEDAAVVDVLSGGRLQLVVIGGYAPDEFRLFGRDSKERDRLIRSGLATLERAWRGDPLPPAGVAVSPLPVQAGGPPIRLGGSSRAAARRAAELGHDFFPNSPEYWADYSARCRELGREPGPTPSGRRLPGFVHVSRDPERAWAVIAPHAAHENAMYAAWLSAGRVAAAYSHVEDTEQLRAMGRYVVVTPEEARDLFDGADSLMLHPMMGGLPEELAWESLELFVDEVLPHLRPASP